MTTFSQHSSFGHAGGSNGACVNSQPSCRCAKKFPFRGSAHIKVSHAPLPALHARVFALRRLDRFSRLPRRGCTGRPWADKAAPATDRREPLPGLAPSPRALPHVGRWQVALRVPSGRIYAVAWSPDGKKIAHSEMGYVRICDATTAETEHVLVGHSARVTSIDWNGATNRIASASFDQTVRLWSASGARSEFSPATPAR